MDRVGFPSIHRWLVRWIVSGSVLILGLALLSFPNPDFGIWWANVGLAHGVVQLPMPTRIPLMGIPVTVMTAAGILAWPSLSEESTLLLASSPPMAWVLWLAAYIASIAGLIRLERISTGAQVISAAQLLAIAGLVALAATSWCFTTMPATFWRRWIGRNRDTFAAVTVCGVLVYTLAHHYTRTLMASVPALADLLQKSTLFISAFLLGIFSGNAFYDPGTGVVGLGGFSVRVTLACAGWEGMGLFAAFMAIYLWLYRRFFRFPNALLLLPAGLSALYFLNAVRIAVLIWIGTWNPNLALDGFHSLAGWVFFNCVTLAAVAASWRFGLFARNVSEGEASDAAAPYLIPALAIIATAMIKQAFPHALVSLYPLRVLVGAGALWLCWKRIPQRLDISWVTVAVGGFVFLTWIALQTRTNAPSAASYGVGWANLPTFAVVGWILFRVIGAVVIVPIAEELAFRGYLLRRFVSIDFEHVGPSRFTWLAILGSSALFGALHTQWLAGTVAGVLFAMAFYRRGYLSDAIVSHSVANGMLAAYVLATGRWFLWS